MAVSAGRAGARRGSRPGARVHRGDRPSETRDSLIRSGRDQEKAPPSCRYPCPEGQNSARGSFGPLLSLNEHSRGQWGPHDLGLVGRVQSSLEGPLEVCPTVSRISAKSALGGCVRRKDPLDQHETSQGLGGPWIGRFGANMMSALIRRLSGWMPRAPRNPWGGQCAIND